MFTSMVDQLLSERTESKTISAEEYQQWQELYTWDAIQDQRYGQSFCNYFDITDHRLFYDRDWASCDRLIRREYISRS